MAARIAFFFVLSLYLTGSKIPGRLELFNPDVEVTSTGIKLAGERAWTPRR